MSWVHPQMLAIMQDQAKSPLTPPETMPIAAARAQFFASHTVWNTMLPPMQAHDTVMGGVPCLHLVPEGASPGWIVLVHGGGWTFGSPATHERSARLIASQAGVQVLVPDYRLAPEHAAPAGIDDVLAVLDALPSGGKVALCGDSAGANIALAAALDRPARKIDFLSLQYGCFAPDFDTESHASHGDGTFGLSTARMRWYWQNWLGAAADKRAVPLRRELRGLPPCHLLAAGLDPLLDDTLMLAAGLARADVPVRMDVIPGVIHGFLQMTSRLDPARDATTMIAAMLKAALEQ